jgi:hypothetical protein
MKEVTPFECEGKLYWWDDDKQCILCGTPVDVEIENVPKDVIEKWNKLKLEKGVEK